MSTRDVSASTFVGNAGAATLDFKVTLSGSTTNASYTESFDSWLNSYSPRVESVLDFSSSAAAQSFTPNANTRFILIVPPTGCTATLQVGSAATVSECTVFRANTPLIFGSNGAVAIYVKPSATFAGLWRVLQF
jgi:hypothetical protein